MTEQCINGSSKEETKFILEHLPIAEVPSTKSAVLLDKLVELLKRYNIDPHKIKLCFWMELTPCLARSQISRNKSKIWFHI